MSSSVAGDPQTQTAAPAATRMSARAWGLLVVVCGALFLEGIDIAMLNVAVPAIRADLGLSTGAAHWVISAYVLGYAGFMLLGGRSADLFGRRRVFLVALAVFVAFSGLGGLAGSSAILIVARFVTGVAAGFMTPTGLSIVTTGFPEGPLRDRAVVIYGAIGSAGFTLGLVAGGLLTSVSWRWVFFAPVILGALILVAGRALIRADEPRGQATSRGGFDLGGAVTITGTMICAILALVLLGEGRDIGTGVVALAAAAGLLVAFVVIERRSDAPLVRIGVLRQGLLAAASAAGALFMAAFFGFQFLVTLQLQDLRGWSPLATGLTFAVIGIDLVLAPIVTPPLVRRFGNAAIMVVGFVFAAVGYGLFLRVGPDWSYLDMLPSLILIGIAFTLAYGPLTLAAADGVDEEEHGLAGGVLYTAFQFGAALGLAIIAVVLDRPDHGVSLADYRSGHIVPTVLAGAAAVTVGAAILARRQSRPASSSVHSGG